MAPLFKAALLRKLAVILEHYKELYICILITRLRRRYIKYDLADGDVKRYAWILALEHNG